jgi:hypothetical protein
MLPATQLATMIYVLLRILSVLRKRQFFRVSRSERVNDIGACRCAIPQCGVGFEEGRPIFLASVLIPRSSLSLSPPFWLGFLVGSPVTAKPQQTRTGRERLPKRAYFFVLGLPGLVSRP